MTTDEIRQELFKLQDLKYRDFHKKLIPNVDSDSVIGVRTPELRKLAKTVGKDGKAGEFLSELPHKYYEENNLHAFLIEQIKDYDDCIAELNKFLPYVDNWATCDMMRPKCFKKYTDELIEQILIWLESDDTYTVRFAIEALMVYFLDDKFNVRFLELVADVKSEEYYINMMIAWYFATALAKQYGSAIPYLRENRLSEWTHNKTIQKSVESYRITDEQKVYLQSLRR